MVVGVSSRKRASEGGEGQLLECAGRCVCVVPWDEWGYMAVSVEGSGGGRRVERMRGDDITLLA